MQHLDKDGCMPAYGPEVALHHCKVACVHTSFTKRGTVAQAKSNEYNSLPV